MRPGGFIPKKGSLKTTLDPMAAQKIPNSFPSLERKGNAGVGHRNDPRSRQIFTRYSNGVFVVESVFEYFNACVTESLTLRRHFRIFVIIKVTGHFHRAHFILHSVMVSWFAKMSSSFSEIPSRLRTRVTTPQTSRQISSMLRFTRHSAFARSANPTIIVTRVDR